MPLSSPLSAPLGGVADAAVLAGAGGVVDPPAAAGVAAGGIDDAACPTGCAPEAGVDGTAAADAGAVFRLSWPSSRRMRCSIAPIFFNSASFEAGAPGTATSGALGSAANVALAFVTAIETVAISIMVLRRTRDLLR